MSKNDILLDCFIFIQEFKSLNLEYKYITYMSF